MKTKIIEKSTKITIPNCCMGILSSTEQNIVPGSAKKMKSQSALTQNGCSKNSFNDKSSPPEVFPQISVPKLKAKLQENNRA